MSAIGTKAEPYMMSQSGCSGTLGSFGIVSGVKTRTTPGTASAAAVSTVRIVPRAIGLGTSTACSRSGIPMSPV